MYKKVFLSIMALFMGVSSALAKDEADLTMADTAVRAGKEVIMPIMATGGASGFQFDVSVPEGIIVKSVLRGENIKTQDENEEYIFVMRTSTQANGDKRITCYSNEAKKAEAGEVFRLKIAVDESVAAGEYDIKLTGIVCSYINSSINTYKEYTAKLTVSDGKAENEAAYTTLSAQVAEVQKALDAAKTTVETDCKDVAAQFTEQLAGIQISIDSLTADVKVKYEAVELTAESTIDTVAIIAAIDRLLADANEAQKKYEESVGIYSVFGDNVKIKAIYDTNGKKVNEPISGKLYIVVYDNGVRKKIVTK